MRRVHRFVPSTRNKIERLWGEVNVRVNLPLKLVFVHMEWNNILDVGNQHHIGAIQAFGRPLLQHRLDLFKQSYNIHHVRPSRGSEGGKPVDLWNKCSSAPQST